MPRNEILQKLCELSDEANLSSCAQIGDAIDLLLEAEEHDSLNDLIPLMAIYSEVQRVKNSFREVACAIGA